ARNALLNDPAYNFTLAAEGITGSSTTAEWNTFADSVGSFTNATAKELFTFNYLHDIYNTDFTSVLETSIADIGLVLNKSGATPSNPYGDWKTLSLWGMWYPMLFDRQAQYDADLEAFYVDWPMPKTDLAYLDAFYTYKNLYLNITGTPEWTLVPDTWNWGLINDPVLQESIRALYFQNETTRMTTYSTIQEQVGTVIYTSMFISQDNQGYALNKKFAIDWNTWGGFDFGEVSIGPGYETAGVPVEIIPGFPLIALLGVAGISIIAIGMKKRKNFK
ncbi:MAG: Loki-CTERM sorting domain-containing protein, partial [Promethearchaeota archaeon]